jgi:hypothetical protein
VTLQAAKSHTASNSLTKGNYCNSADVIWVTMNQTEPQMHLNGKYFIYPTECTTRLKFTLKFYIKMLLHLIISGCTVRLWKKKVSKWHSKTYIFHSVHSESVSVIFTTNAHNCHYIHNNITKNTKLYMFRPSLVYHCNLTNCCIKHLSDNIWSLAYVE